MLKSDAGRIVYLFILAIFWVSGCSVIRIESEPPGAVILYSATGMEPWKPLGDPENPLETPALFYRFRSSHHFFRVDKSGYVPPLPKIVETYPFHRETLSFQLEKTPQTVEKEYLDKGYIRYQNQWVNPKDAGLVEYKGEWMKPGEKFTAEQKDRGLILYEDKWMTPGEKEKSFARDQTEKGLVPLKSRWVTPDEKSQEEKIDLTVEEVFQKEHRNPEIPSVVGTITANQTRIRVLNGIGDKVIFYFSGKKSLRIALDPYESQNMDILPGNYRIAGVALTQNIAPSFWTFEFKPGFRYSLVEEGEPLQSNIEEGIAITPEDIKKQYEIPELKIPDSPTSGTRERRNQNRSGGEGGQRP
jgi:hypothetical protein